MKPIDILPLTIDLVVIFFNSARDALLRGKHVAPEQLELGEVRGLYVFNRGERIVQAAIETVITSFLSIEALINTCYFNELNENKRLSESDKFINKKWVYGMNIMDKLSLILGQYTMVEIDKIKPLLTLFKEFVTFRNKIIHSRPDIYDALVEQSDIPNEVTVHALDWKNDTKSFPTTKLSEELGRIGTQDAEKCYEIMLLIIALLNSNFGIDLELSWYDSYSDQSTGLCYGTVLETIDQLSIRYFGFIDPNDYVIKKA